MQQNQCVQTTPLEFAQQFQELILRETKKQQACELYNFSSSTKHLSNIKSTKHLQSHRSLIESCKIISPQPKRLLANPIEGRALLTKLMFPSARQKGCKIEQRKESNNQSSKNIHSARRLSAYSKPEINKEMQEQSVNKFVLHLQQSNYYLNKASPCKAKTSRMRQMSLMDVEPISSRNLYVNGTSSQFTRRDKILYKK